MIRKLLAAAAFVAAMGSSALAMDASSVPPKFPIPWGNSAGGSYIRNIPTASQIGIQNGAASLTDGFPPLTFLPVGAGGTPPFGQDFNGILKQITQWSQWQGAGAPVQYDSAFSSSIGGYPAGATLQTAASPTEFWLSTADNNTTDPDTGGAGWILYSPVGSQARSLATSGSFTINATDSSIGITASAASSATLPTGVPNGKTIKIQDLASNFDLYNVTISAPGGETIAGNSSVVLNINGQNAEFTYYSGPNAWSFNYPSTVPLGNIQIATAGTADPGFMLCYGEAVSRTTYAALFAKIGISYGTGDGSTTFNLPDLRGRMPAGQDNMGSTAANRITVAGGTIDGTILGNTWDQQGIVGGITQAMLAAFSLSVTQPTFTVPMEEGSGYQNGGCGCTPTISGGATAATRTTNVGVTTGGSGATVPTLSNTQIVTYEIRMF